MMGDEAEKREGRDATRICVPRDGPNKAESKFLENQ